MTGAATEPLSRQIVRRLRTSKRKHFHVDKLVGLLGVPRAEVEAAIDALAAAGELVRTRKGRVALADRLGWVTGTVRVGRRGRAVVIPDDPDVPIALPSAGLRPAMHGDRVVVAVEPYRQRGLRKGTLQRVLERRTTMLVGRVEETRPHGPIFIPAGPHSGYVATLDPDGVEAPAGQVVAASVVEYPTSHRNPVVRVDRVLGPVGALPTEIDSVCHTLGIPTEIDPEAEREAARFGEPNADSFAGRLDLREATTITIDPVDARDFDDAVSIDRTAGVTRVTVSIADVSHYVSPGSAIDATAYERGTSVYFPGRCVPMLPERLSSELASLRPDVERLTVSVVLEIDERGAARGVEFARSVIRSRARLTYEQAQEILDGGAGSDPAVAESVRALGECTRRMYACRIARGAIDLDVPEAVVAVDETGNPTAISRRPRLDAHRLIEELMLAANEAVAARIEQAGVGFLYRIHERPDEDAAQSLAARLSVLGLRLPGDGAGMSPTALQAVLKKAAGGPVERLVNLMVLRSLTRARYSAFKEMHFGLASPSYTHFTSPIRRYPDLVVHRALCAVLEAGGRGLPSAEALAPVAEQCSDRERRAMEAERDVDSAAAIIFMENRIGDTLGGVVTSVERWGFFVELDEVFVEGFVPVARLDEYYDYVAERMELQSRTSRYVIHVGERVRVTMIGADLSSRRLELEPARLR